MLFVILIIYNIHNWTIFKAYTLVVKHILHSTIVFHKCLVRCIIFETLPFYYKNLNFLAGFYVILLHLLYTYLWV